MGILAEINKGNFPVIIFQLTESCCTCISSVMSEFSMASSSTSQLCWDGSSDPLRELEPLIGTITGMFLGGVVCADLPSTLSAEGELAAKSSANPDEHLLWIREQKNNEMIFQGKLSNSVWQTNRLSASDPMTTRT